MEPVQPLASNGGSVLDSYGLAVADRSFQPDPANGQSSTPLCDCRLGSARVTWTGTRQAIAALRQTAFLADFSSTFASRLLSKFLMAFVVALAARRLGPHAFGTYVAITTYVAMAGSIVDFGLAPYVTRTISEGNPLWRPLAI